MFPVRHAGMAGAASRPAGRDGVPGPNFATVAKVMHQAVNVFYKSASHLLPSLMLAMRFIIISKGGAGALPVVMYPRTNTRKPSRRPVVSRYPALIMRGIGVPFQRRPQPLHLGAEGVTISGYLIKRGAAYVVLLKCVGVDNYHATPTFPRHGRY